MTAEQGRLDGAEIHQWRRWGPYVSERQWGTVREDYSSDGSAWSYFPHDHARSRAYRWGEDGIAGISDDQQLLCFSLGMWNGNDPILKERLFGLTGEEGNHGEDVKELYYYLDSTPTHSYMRMLYKYPQAAYPYDDLVAENGARSKADPEYEILDTGVFDEGRYFDVFVEYVKAGPEDILVRIEAYNRGPDAHPLWIVPQLWARNTWSWDYADPVNRVPKQRPAIQNDGKGCLRVDRLESDIDSRTLGPYWLHFEDDLEVQFCENETNTPRLFGVEPGADRYKDGIANRVVHGTTHSAASSRDPEGSGEAKGSKVGILSQLMVPAGGKVQVRLRLAATKHKRPFADFDAIAASGKNEADEFYAVVQAGLTDEDERRVQRQAYAGMLWSKQFYYFDVDRWLKGDPLGPPPPPGRAKGRNRDWFHLNNADIISMPDKWEYPWYAAWDLAFHCLPLATLDAAFAKEQLLLMTREWYMHPSGQLPAYEWAFGDVNPPVHAWGAWRVFQIDRKQQRLRGGDPSYAGDLDFLERVFHKLLINFTWWVNRKDSEGNNVFQGGFLGLDNIGVFDRSAPLPTGGHIHQADGTSWMAMYSLNLMRIALELALHRKPYEDIATKFFEHFLYIAQALSHLGDEEHGLWDEEDQFFFDVLHLPNGDHTKLKIWSMVGLIPLFAVETLEPEMLDKLPGFRRRVEWFLKARPELAALVSRWHEPGRGDRRLLSLLRGHRMKCVLKRMLSESEFLSPHGVRALSKRHLEQPYQLEVEGQEYVVDYQPGESKTSLFGGNSNWRGPVWFPVNYLIIESLQRFHHYYGDDFTVECPTGSGQFLSIGQVADELADRLTRLFLKAPDGSRPVNGASATLQTDPHFKDYIHFYEYFHGETGRGIGASHQTGWTGLVAKLLIPRE